MPNRIIKESALDSQDLDALSNGAERLFWRLIVVADDFGRFEGSPQVVKARCFPRKVDTLRTNKVQEWMKELAPNLVRFYTVSGRSYGAFLNWEKHQQKRAKMSKFPDPPEVVENHDDSICNHLQSNVSEIEIENVIEIEKRDASASALPVGLDAQVWSEFKKHRQRLRRPLTHHAETLLLKELDKLCAGGAAANEIVEQSIANGWQGLFELKGGLTNGRNKKAEPKGFAGIREVLDAQNDR